MSADAALRKTVLVVALANLGYFGIEFVAALWTQSVALFADSVDFLEDAAVNLIIVFALAWSARRRAQVGFVLAGLMLVPAAAFLVTLIAKMMTPTPPLALEMSVIGMGALVVNVTCAFLLARHRAHAGSMAKAAFLSARNDALANVAIIAAGLVTLAQASIWPDVIVGLAIAWLNLDAAREVWSAARREHDAPPKA